MKADDEDSHFYLLRAFCWILFAHFKWIGLALCTYCRSSQKMPLHTGQTTTFRAQHNRSCNSCFAYKYIYVSICVWTIRAAPLALSCLLTNFKILEFETNKLHATTEQWQEENCYNWLFSLQFCSMKKEINNSEELRASERRRGRKRNVNEFEFWIYLHNIEALEFRKDYSAN